MLDKNKLPEKLGYILDDVVGRPVNACLYVGSFPVFSGQPVTLADGRTGAIAVKEYTGGRPFGITIGTGYTPPTEKGRMIDIVYAKSDSAVLCLTGELMHVGDTVKFIDIKDVEGIYHVVPCEVDDPDIIGTVISHAVGSQNSVICVLLNR